MFKKYSLVAALMLALSGDASVNAAAGRDMNIISNVVACGDGLIGGGATVICVQTVITTTGGGGGAVPAGREPIPAVGGARRAGDVNPAATGVTVTASTPPGVQASVVSKTGQQAPDKTAIIAFDPAKNFTPVVNLGQVRTATRFPLYIPGASVVSPKTYLYTFTPTAGLARGRAIQILLKAGEMDATLYQHTQAETVVPESAATPTPAPVMPISPEQPAGEIQGQLDLYIYQKNPAQNTWSRIGIITGINQEIDNPQAIMPAQLTVQPDGKVIVPLQNGQQQTFDLAELYQRGPNKSRLGQQATGQRRGASRTGIQPMGPQAGRPALRRQ